MESNIGKLLETVAHGGTGSTIALLLLNLVVIVLAGRHLITLLLANAKQQLENQEKIVIEKDKMLAERAKNLEMLVEKYYRQQEKAFAQQDKTLAIVTRVESTLQELSIRTMVILDRNNLRKG